MPRAVSPLRYPGGKTCLYPIISQILRENRIEHRDYVEPFAGGCGLALSLLYGSHVSDIHINDVDPSIWAFWHSTLEHTSELVDRIRHTPVTIDEWHVQREIHRQMNSEDPVALGFATFFLNRTNRSGIIKLAGPMGGRDQSGPNKIDCRFNREDLGNRIRRVARYRNRIHLYKQDALPFIKSISVDLPDSSFFCIDPPYFKKGKGLYTNFYQPEDHGHLAEAILALENPWVVTYDNEPAISKLYRSRRRREFDITYTLQAKRRGTELLIASKGLRLGSDFHARQASQACSAFAA